VANAAKEAAYDIQAAVREEEPKGLQYEGPQRLLLIREASRAYKYLSLLT